MKRQYTCWSMQRTLHRNGYPTVSNAVRNTLLVKVQDKEMKTTVWQLCNHSIQGFLWSLRTRYCLHMCKCGLSTWTDMVVNRKYSALLSIRAISSLKAIVQVSATCTEPQSPECSDLISFMKNEKQADWKPWPRLNLRAESIVKTVQVKGERDFTASYHVPI